MIHWIEEHPYLSGGLVAVVLLWFVVRRSKSSATGQNVYNIGPSEGLQAAEIQAGLGQQQVQAGLAAALANTDAARSIYGDQIAAQTTLGKFAADVQTATVLAQQDTTNNETAASLALGLATVGSPAAFNGTIGGLSFNGRLGFTPPPQPVPIVTGQQSNQVQQQQNSNQQNNVIAAASGAPSGGNVVIPAGFFTEVNPQGFFDSKSFVIPQRNQGEDYWQYRARVEAAAGTQNCGPMDPQCIANNTGLFNFIDTYETGHF